MTPGYEGFTVVWTMVVGLFAGYYVDRWVGTAPWFTLIGVTFGIGAAIVYFSRR